MVSKHLIYHKLPKTLSSKTPSFYYYSTTNDFRILRGYPDGVVTLTEWGENYNSLQIGATWGSR